MPPRPSPHDGFARITADPDRFWDRVAIAGPDECWLWTGTRHQNGYGLVYFRKVGRLTSATASRVAYALSAGLAELPARNEPVCHHCDNPPCCNPAHLWLGTPKENAVDRVVKERSGTRLTEDDVRIIVGSDASARALATRFEVSIDMIHRIRRGVTWRHVSRADAVMPPPSPRARRLDIEAVRAIRASDAPLAELADVHGVSVSTISRVRSGAIWKRVL